MSIDQEIPKGTIISDRYQVQATIGKGGMAKVYKAHHLLLDRDVAIKTILPDIASLKPDAVEALNARFFREARLATNLVHRNIIQTREFGELPDGGFFIVLDYCDGTTLRKIIKRRAPLDPARAVAIAVQILDAIAEAHRQNIVHRDLKPSNIMVEDDGVVKVLDFGLAKMLTSSEFQVTQMGALLGTPRYMSPEQITSEPIAGAADQYAVGLMLFEMLTGQFPFKASTTKDYLRTRVLIPPRSIHEFEPSLPARLEVAISTSLARHAKDRWATCAEFCEELRAVLKVLPEPAPEDLDSTLAPELQGEVSRPAPPQHADPDANTLVVQSEQPDLNVDQPTPIFNDSIWPESAPRLEAEAQQAPPQTPLETADATPRRIFDAPSTSPPEPSHPVIVDDEVLTTDYDMSAVIRTSAQALSSSADATDDLSDNVCADTDEDPGEDPGAIDDTSRPGPSEPAPLPASTAAVAAEPVSAPVATPATDNSRLIIAVMGLVIVGLSIFVAVLLTRGAEGKSPEKLRQLALNTFGLLPATSPLDVKQPMSQERVDLGRALYFDPRLSTSKSISCNTCHPLEQYGADGLKRSKGADGNLMARNTPSIYNIGLHQVFRWDGTETSLEAQNLRPLLLPNGHGFKDEQEVVTAVEAIPGYRALFDRAFPDAGEAPITYANVGLALGAFTRTLNARARIDDFIDGDLKVLYPEELRGLELFISLGCVTCHVNQAFGGTNTQKLGLIHPYESDDPGMIKVTGQPQHRAVFKVASLRNVVKTGPWLHDGSIDDLGEVIRVMAYHQLGVEVSDEEVLALKAFLDTLTSKLDAEQIKRPALP